MRKTKLTLLLLAAMLVGVCVGFFAYDAVIRARIQHFSQIPGNMPEHIVARLTERLKLDTDQQAAVRAIVQSYDARLQEAREQSRATLDALFAGGDVESCEFLYLGHDVLLTAGQQAALDERGVEVREVPAYYYRELGE